jgi:iron complex transport system ATP-binding protein
VLTPERLAEVFGVRGAVTTHPLTGRPHLVFSAMTSDRSHHGKAHEA